MKTALAKTAGFRILLALVAACQLAACTVIHIEGNSNSVSDTGGHDAEIALPAGR
ncbi:hypothetical protein PQR34_44790 [Paraburkholderia sediminicola]|uniref:hypothetical protein n=1 Tax=Paraburkholderia sediminicola TaxID=458836 RepID=UPI0038BDE076